MKLQLKLLSRSLCQFLFIFVSIKAKYKHTIITISNDSWHYYFCITAKTVQFSVVLISYPASTLFPQGHRDSLETSTVQLATRGSTHLIQMQPLSPRQIQPLTLPFSSCLNSALQHTRLFKRGNFSCPHHLRVLKSQPSALLIGTQ